MKGGVLGRAPPKHRNRCKEAQRSSSASLLLTEPSRELVNPALGLAGSSLTGLGPRKATSAHAGVNWVWSEHMAITVTYDMKFGLYQGFSNSCFPVTLNLGSLLTANSVLRGKK